MPETYHAGHTPSDEERLVELVAEVRSLIADLEQGAFNHETKTRDTITMTDLARRARVSRLDGYPTSSLGALGGGSTVKDEQGVPMPGVTDRTGETAALLADLGGNPDPTRAALRQVFRGMAKARAGLHEAVGALVTVTPKEPVDVDDVCRVCGQPPVFRADRCRWCYGFFLEWKQDPPEVLWRAHLEGRRITETMVRETLERPPGGRGRVRR